MRTTSALWSMCKCSICLRANFSANLTKTSIFVILKAPLFIFCTEHNALLNTCAWGQAAELKLLHGQRESEAVVIHIHLLDVSTCWYLTRLISCHVLFFSPLTTTNFVVKWNVSIWCRTHPRLHTTAATSPSSCKVSLSACRDPLQDACFAHSKQYWLMYWRGNVLNDKIIIYRYLDMNLVCTCLQYTIKSIRTLLLIRWWWPCLAC